VYISDLLKNRDNNFNLLRIFFALFVIYVHSFDLLKQVDPISGFLNKKLSIIGVEGFFIISGFLIFYSFRRNFENKTILKYFVSRFLRIFPGLIFMVFFTGIFLGVFYTTLSLTEFFTHKHTIKYFIYNSTLMKNIVYVLQGVFENNPLRAVNGSLWTLPYELLFYCLIPFIFFIVKTSKTRLALVLILLISCNYFYFDLFVFVSKIFPFLPKYFYSLFLSFLVGVFYCLYKDNIKLKFSFFILSLIVFILSIKVTFPLSEVISIFSFAYIVFYLSAVRLLNIRDYNKLGDYSYGLYIWAFPIQQLIIHHKLNINPYMLCFLSSFLTLLFAIASWKYIEKPALKFVRK